MSENENGLCERLVALHRAFVIGIASRDAREGRLTDRSAREWADECVELFRGDLEPVAAALKASESRVSALQEALARAQSWHESEDKALSKSGRSDADHHWRRLQHREQLTAIRGALTEAEYDAAWGRMNARYEQETADVGE